jgi:IclR family pca regulon transcriptional regulator
LPKPKPAVLEKYAVYNEDYSGDPNFMTSLARGLMVIEAFTASMPQMTISQVSQRTGLSRAAVRRCLYTLSKLGFVGCDDGQRFALRARILSLSHAFTRSSTLAHAAQPLLDRLSHRLNESCSVATCEGEDIVYIARASVARIMAVDLTVGSRLPAYCTSMGRVMLAHKSPLDLEQYLTRLKMHRYTARTINSVEKLRQVLKNVERFGYALVDQELELGLRSLAVPVRSPSGKVIAAINVGAQAQRMPIPDLQTRYLQHLLEASQELTMMLR